MVTRYSEWLEKVKHTFSSVKSLRLHGKEEVVFLEEWFSDVVAAFPPPRQNVTSSPQYSTFLEHIIPRFLTFLQDGEVQFLQEKPTQVGLTPTGPTAPVGL